MRSGNSVPVLVLGLLAGCGGGDSAVVAPDVETGVFIDSVVAGIKYRTATQQGVTDSQGRFNYVAGETVVFSIGGVDLPAVQAADSVQPQDIFTTVDGVTNLARLLQSLDTDGNPANGIVLNAQVHTAFSSTTNATVVFNVPAATFGANATVANMVAQYGVPGSTLVTVEAAQAHLHSSSLTGSWYVADANMYYSFTEDGHYMQVHTDGGIEYGTYDWNPLTAKLTGHPVFDSNGDAGFNIPPRTGATVTPSDSSLRFLDPTAPQNDPDRDLTALPVRSANSAIVGGWLNRDDGDGYTGYAVFTPDGRFAFAWYWDQGRWPEDIAPANRPQIGAQFGTYVWNPQNGSITYTLGLNRAGSVAIRPNETTGQVLLVTGDTMAPAGGDEGIVLHRIR